MEELKQLEKNIISKLEQIRDKENKSLNEIEEYANLQEKLKCIHKVMVWIKEDK